MKKDDKFLNFLKDIMKTILIYIFVIMIMTQFFIRPFRVEGESMMPNLTSNELGISNIIGLKLNSVKRFDIVIVYQENTKRYLVKRVIGLPGETIHYEYDTLYVNGIAVEEPFLDQGFMDASTDHGYMDFTSEFGPVKIEEDSYFLLGDNRLRSSDSRVYGTFTKNEIKSKNGFVIFPLNKIRKLGGN